MSIILLPFKIVFLILTFLLKGVLYILSYTIIFFSDFCGAIHYIIRLGSGIFAVGESPWRTDGPEEDTGRDESP